MDPATQLFVILLICGTLLVVAELFVPGGVLGVRMVPVAGELHVLLSGPATLVYSGEVALA